MKTTWHCSQCGFSSKLQYTVKKKKSKTFKILSSISQVKQHIETHITTIVHQCALCPKILKTRNALRAHMNQKHDSKPRQTIVESPPWMGGGGSGNSGDGQSGNFSHPVQVRQVGILMSYWGCSLSRAIMFELYSAIKLNMIIGLKISIRYNS